MAVNGRTATIGVPVRLLSGAKPGSSAALSAMLYMMATATARNAASRT